MPATASPRSAASASSCPSRCPARRSAIERSGTRARLVDVIAPSADRVAPPCRHFGTCGGCALQHMAMPAYLAWKREIVRRSFALHHIDAEVEPVAATPPGSRRRAVFSAVNTAGRLILGFRRRASHEIVAVEECPVLSADIVAALPLIRAIAAPRHPHAPPGAGHGARRQRARHRHRRRRPARPRCAGGARPVRRRAGDRPADGRRHRSLRQPAAGACRRGCGAAASARRLRAGLRPRRGGAGRSGRCPCRRCGAGRRPLLGARHVHAAGWRAAPR